MTWERCEACPLFFPDSWEIERHRAEDHPQLNPDGLPEDQVRLG